MDKNTKNILIAIGIAGILFFFLRKNKAKDSNSVPAIPESSNKPDLTYEQHTFGLIAEEIQSKGKKIGIDEKLIEGCKETRGSWKWQKCFDKFGKNKSIDTLLGALEIIDKDELTEDQIKNFNKLMLKE